MFVSKSLISSSDSSSPHLPTISKTIRRRYPLSSSLSYNLMASTKTSTNSPENVSALKAKYIGYAMWLKASSRQNREPLFTHELLKHSLCQMGIDSVQAEQLVSTCSWYVYQFQKELQTDTEQTDQSTMMTEYKKNQQSSKQRFKKRRPSKFKTSVPPREYSGESATTITSTNKENHTLIESSSFIRNKYSVLPAIHHSNHVTSPRSRRVDFNNEKQFVEKQTGSRWQSVTFKARLLPKLRPIEPEVSNNIYEPTPGNTPAELDLSSSQKNLHRNSLTGPHTRSILRKQASSDSSIASTEFDTRKNRNPVLSPVSTSIDEAPLGTRSQRLFGGSEYFAEIMNELEQQSQQ